MSNIKDNIPAEINHLVETGSQLDKEIYWLVKLSLLKEKLGNAELESSIGELRRNMKVSESKIKQQNIQNEELQLRYTNLESESKALASICEEKESENTSLVSKYKKFELECKRLESDNKGLGLQNKRLESELKALKLQYDKMGSRKEELGHILKASEAECMNFKHEHQTLESKYNEYISTNKKLEKEVEKLKKENKKQESTNKNLELKINLLESANKDLESENDKLRKEVSDEKEVKMRRKKTAVDVIDFNTCKMSPSSIVGVKEEPTIPNGKQKTNDTNKHMKKIRDLRSENKANLKSILERDINSIKNKIINPLKPDLSLSVPPMDLNSLLKSSSFIPKAKNPNTPGDVTLENNSFLSNLSVSSNSSSIEASRLKSFDIRKNGS